MEKGGGRGRGGEKRREDKNSKLSEFIIIKKKLSL